MERLPVPNQTCCVDRLVLDSDDAGPRKTRSSSLPAKLSDEVEEIIAYVEETLRNDTDFLGSSTNYRIQEKESVYQNETTSRSSSSSSSNFVRSTLLTPVSAGHVQLKARCSLNSSEPSRPVSADSGNPDSECCHTRPVSRNSSVGIIRNDKEREPNLDKVVINVGGQRFTTLKSTLQNVSNTRLSRLSEQDMFFDRTNNEYFFDRNPRCFESILDFYRTGNLHFMHGLCGPSIKQELDFWQINEVSLPFSSYIVVWERTTHISICSYSPLECQWIGCPAFSSCVPVLSDLVGLGVKIWHFHHCNSIAIL